LDQPEVLRVTSVTSGFFEELGEVRSKALALRTGSPTWQDRLAVISDALWRTRFAEDPAAIGRKLILDKEVYTIIGVAAKGFAFPKNQKSGCRSR